jgi:hypothetical protein
MNGVIKELRSPEGKLLAVQLDPFVKDEKEEEKPVEEEKKGKRKRTEDKPSDGDK